MASMQFIIENDEPKVLAVQGDLMDIVACTTYMIGRIYNSLHTQLPAAGSALKKMLSQAVGDPDSPVWQIEPEEGEITICTQLPKNNDGSV
jgi:hypothetical protein